MLPGQGWGWGGGHRPPEYVPPHQAAFCYCSPLHTPGLFACHAAPWHVRVLHSLWLILLPFSQFSKCFDDYIQTSACKWSMYKATFGNLPESSRHHCNWAASFYQSMHHQSTHESPGAKPNSAACMIQCSGMTRAALWTRTCVIWNALVFTSSIGIVMSQDVNKFYCGHFPHKQKVRRLYPKEITTQLLTVVTRRWSITWASRTLPSPVAFEWCLFIKPLQLKWCLFIYSFLRQGLTI